MTSNQQKHLEFLQGAISRMARCSFGLKGWAVCFAITDIALSVLSDPSHILLLPLFVAWGLDAYYLGVERCYRARWDEATAPDNAAIVGWDMKPAPMNFAIWREAALSKTVLPFHGAITLTVAILLI